MKKKQYTVTFYRPQLGLKDKKGDNFKDEFLKKYKKNNELLNGSQTFGLKFVDSDKDYIFCEMRKYRDDAPHIGTPRGVDKEISLLQNEHILEKSFILYSKAYKAFALQSSQSFRSPSCFLEVINNQGLNDNVITSVVLGNSADSRLKNNASNIAKFVVAIANPTSKKANTSDDWGTDLLSIGDGATGRLEVIIQGDMRGNMQQPLKAGLVEKIKKSIKFGDYDKAIATTSTGEDIDIINDRLRAKIEVDMLGRYPAQRSVQDELIRVFHNQSNELVSLKN